MVRYFSVDEEFSGLKHRKNCLLSIGMIEVSKKNGVWVPNYDREFYLELKPHGEIDKEAMEINKLNITYLELFGSNQKNATREIRKYLDLAPTDTAVFIAYCGVLDKIYMDQLFQDVLEDNPFNYEIIELSSLAIGKLGFEWGFTEKDLLEKLEINDLNNKEKHNALSDAKLQALEFCGIMNYKGSVE